MAIQNEIDLLDAMKMRGKIENRCFFLELMVLGWNVFEVKQHDQLQKGTFGIPEPRWEKSFDPDQLDLVVVPGIAFDVQGYRLGYGGGYYDRLFSQLSLT